MTPGMAGEGRGRRRAVVMSPWPWMYSMEGGGGTPIEADILFALIEGGFEVDLIVPPSDRSSGFDAVTGLQVHRTGPLRTPRLGYAGRVALWLEQITRFALRGMLVSRRGRRPDLFYGMSALTIPSAWFCGRFSSRPAIGLLFGTFLFPRLESTSKMLRSSFEEVVAFKTPLDRLVVLDDGTRGDRVAAWLGVPPTRLRYWMHGVDRSECQAACANPSSVRAELGLPTHGPLAVSASRLADWKRV